MHGQATWSSLRTYYMCPLDATNCSHAKGFIISFHFICSGYYIILYDCIVIFIYGLVVSLMAQGYRECNNQSCITLECDMAFQPIRTQESGHVSKLNDIDQSCVF